MSTWKHQSIWNTRITRNTRNTRNTRDTRNIRNIRKLMLAKITLGTGKSNSGFCKVIRAWHGLNALGQIQ